MKVKEIELALRAGDRFFGWWAAFTLRRWPHIVAATLIATAAGAWGASTLRLESDFEAMLPRDYQSVRDLKRYQREVGSTSTLSIALMSRDVPGMKRLADAIAAALADRMKDRVHYVEYNIRDVRAFFKDNALLYLDAADIEKKHDALRDYIGKRKLAATGFLADLDEEEGGKKEEAPPLDIEKLIAEYQAKAAKDYGTREDGYYVNEKEDMLALSVYPRPGFSGVDRARALIADVDRLIASLKPRSYAKDVTWGFAGPVQVSVDEYQAIRKDIVGTIGICVALIALVCVVYYLRLRQVALLAVTLAAGIAMTMGITRAAIGYLNAQTAFLGSIIIGTGINYGIILLARYTEERRGRAPVEAALATSLAATWQATLAAAVTTAVAFGTLGLSENLSFRQFGFIATVGILLIWAVTLLAMPAMLVMSERIVPLVRGARREFEIPFVPARAARFILARPGSVLAACAVLTVAFALLVARWLPGALEYDFQKLRNKMTFTSGTEALDNRVVGECTKQSTMPVVAVTAGIDESRRYCEGVAAKKARDPRRYATGDCFTLRSLLPGDQERKVLLLGKIDALLAANEKLLPDGLRRQYAEYGAMLRARPVGAADLPETIRRKFRGAAGGDGVVAMVKPVPGKNIWVYENLDKFVGAVRSVDIGGGKTVTASGAPVIFYDLVGTVAHDAPRDTLYAMLGVFLVIVLVAGRLRGALAVTVSLVAGVAAMVGMAALMGTKINFFNFVAIPTAFGTGADYGINILMRYARERGGGEKRAVLERSMVKTGGAVFLCSATTIIGYLSLMTSNNQALVSYGELAIAGELGCLLAAELLLPALIMKLKM